VAGAFVAERKALLAMADFLDTTVELHPAELGRPCVGDRQSVRVGGMERIVAQDVLEIGQHEFLMLLLVVQPERHERREARPGRVVERRDQRPHGLVDMGPVGVDLGHRRAREQTALGAGVAAAHGLVIGIEQIAVIRVAGSVAGPVGNQQRGLEEPADMGEVPFGRTDVQNCLDDVVIDRKRRAQLLAERAHGGVALNGVCAGRRIRPGYRIGTGSEHR